MTNFNPELAALSPERLDPLAPPEFVEFDYSRLDGLLEEPAQAIEHARLGEAVKRLIAWLVRHNNMRPDSPATFGKRIIGLTWVAFPEVFQGRSMSSLARDCGVTPMCLSNYAVEATQRFGIRNRWQAHGRNGEHNETERKP
jgi:hypothetical protein